MTSKQSAKKMSFFKSARYDYGYQKMYGGYDYYNEDGTVNTVRKPGPFWWWMLDYLVSAARWHALSLVCKWRGHDWVDESYGGPDSGAMAGRCERCGYSFHNQLY